MGYTFTRPVKRQRNFNRRENMEWDEDKNEDITEAREWADWLDECKYPGAPLLAAKKHAVTLAGAYRIMYARIKEIE